MRWTTQRWARLSGTVLAGLLALQGSTPLANAQATRTWVSGVGDDSNPCSRTAPCLTWQGALAKSAAGGEIDALDPGDFKVVTIRKAITLDGSGSFGSVQAISGNGVVVNAGVNDRVVLRGLSINGNGSGTSGVQFSAGKQLVIEHTAISGFTGQGIDFEPAAGGQLELSNSDIRNNAGSGILASSSGGVAQVSIDGTRFADNAVGINARSNTRLTVRGSTLANHPGAGLQAQPDTGTSEADIESSLFFLNGVGVLANGQAIVRLSNATIENNATGTLASSGGQVVTFANNQIAGNAIDVSPSTPTPTITPVPSSTPPPTLTSTPTGTSTPTVTSTPTGTPVPPGQSSAPPGNKPAPTAVLGSGGGGGGPPPVDAAPPASPPDNQPIGPAPVAPGVPPVLPVAPVALPAPIVPPDMPLVPANPPALALALPASVVVQPNVVAVDPLAGATVAVADGNLVVGVLPNQDGTPLSATVLDIQPVASPADLPPPNGTLRLTDVTFTVTLADADGAPTVGQVSIAVRPTQGVADMLGGDLSTLVIGFIDDQGNWQTLPTTILPDGTLTALAPGPGTFGILRIAPTFWVAPLPDTDLFGAVLEVIGTDGSLYLVRLPDGTTAWIDPSQVTNVPAPDALPPAPLPPAEPLAGRPY